MKTLRDRSYPKALLILPVNSHSKSPILRKLAFNDQEKVLIDALDQTRV